MKDLQSILAIITLLLLIEGDKAFTSSTTRKQFVSRPDVFPRKCQKRRRGTFSLEAAPWHDFFGAGWAGQSNNEQFNGRERASVKEISNNGRGIPSEDFFSADGEFYGEPEDGTLLGLEKMQNEIGSLIAELQAKRDSNGKEAALGAKLAELSRDLEAYKESTLKKEKERKYLNDRFRSIPLNGDSNNSAKNTESNGKKQPSFHFLSEDDKNAFSSGVKSPKKDTKTEDNQLNDQHDVKTGARDPLHENAKISKSKMMGKKEVGTMKSSPKSEPSAMKKSDSVASSSRRAQTSVKSEMKIPSASALENEAKVTDVSLVYGISDPGKDRHEKAATPSTVDSAIPLVDKTGPEAKSNGFTDPRPSKINGYVADNDTRGGKERPKKVEAQDTMDFNQPITNGFESNGTLQSQQQTNGAASRKTTPSPVSDVYLKVDDSKAKEVDSKFMKDMKVDAKTTSQTKQSPDDKKWSPARGFVDGIPRAQTKRWSPAHGFMDSPLPRFSLEIKESNIEAPSTHSSGQDTSSPRPKSEKTFSRRMEEPVEVEEAPWGTTSTSWYDEPSWHRFGQPPSNQRYGEPPRQRFGEPPRPNNGERINDGPFGMPNDGERSRQRQRFESPPPSPWPEGRRFGDPPPPRPRSEPSGQRFGEPFMGQFRGEAQHGELLGAPPPRKRFFGEPPPVQHMAKAAKPRRPDDTFPKTIFAPDPIATGFAPETTSPPPRKVSRPVGFPPDAKMPPADTRPPPKTFVPDPRVLSMQMKTQPQTAESIAEKPPVKLPMRKRRVRAKPLQRKSAPADSKPEPAVPAQPIALAVDETKHAEHSIEKNMVELPEETCTTLDRAPISIWDTAFPVVVQGNSLRTFSFESNLIERVQVFLKTDGHPLNANVDLWHGPDDTPQKMTVFLEDGSLHTFSTVMEAPVGHNSVAIENAADVGSHFLAAVVGSDFGNGSHGLGPLSDKLSEMEPEDRVIEPDEAKIWQFDENVASVQVLLRNYKRPLHARVELLQGPKHDIKQVVEIYTEDGMARPFYIVIDTPGGENVVRVVNTGPAGFPMDAVAEPYVIDEDPDDQKKP